MAILLFILVLKVRLFLRHFVWFGLSVEYRNRIIMSTWHCSLSLYKSRCRITGTILSHEGMDVPVTPEPQGAKICDFRRRLRNINVVRRNVFMVTTSAFLKIFEVQFILFAIPT